MKRILFIPLLIICLLQSGGMLLIYQIQQFRIQNEMEYELKNIETHFEKLTLTISEFKKSKIKEHEIFYKGKMYDIKSAFFSNDKVELLVINDTKEEGIIKLINRTFNNQNSQKDNLPNQLKKIITLTYLTEVFEHQFVVLESPQQFFQFAEIKFLSFKADIASPPPKSV